MGYWWDNRPGFNHIHKTNQTYIIIAILKKIHDQNMLEYIPDKYTKATFFNQQNYFNSWTECKSVISDA